MLQKAFGKKWGFRIWRLLVAVVVIAILGGVGFGTLHGYATLRDDFGSKATAQTSQQQTQAPPTQPSQSTPQSGGTAGILIECGSNPNGFVRNSVVVGEMKNVAKGMVVHGDCVKENDFHFNKMENSTAPK